MAALAVKDEYQGLAAAVSLGITVLKRCKQNTWAELTAAMSEADPVVVKAFKVLDLSDDQLELIGAHQPELGLLRIAPAATHVICPVCGTFILSSDTAPTRCLVTPGCSGKPAKIGAAVNAKKPAEDPEGPATEPAPALDDEAPVSDEPDDETQPASAPKPAAKKPIIDLDDDFD